MQVEGFGHDEARCGMHQAAPARFTCELCNTRGCADCRFGGEPASGAPARHAVCVACARDGLDQPVPWERRKELGLWRAFADTTKLASTQPTRFFRTPALEKGSTAPILYGLAVYVLGQLLLLITMGILMMIGGAVAGAVSEEPAIAGVFGVYGCFFIGLSPIFAAQGAMQALLGMMIAAGGAHGTLALLKRNDGKFERTLRAVGYSYAPIVWLGVPLCGIYVAYFWMLAVEFKAIRETHRVSGGTALLAVLGYRAAIVLLILAFYGLIVGLAFASIPELSSIH